MKSGQVYQGVLHGCDVSKEGQAGVALSMAYKLDAQGELLLWFCTVACFSHLDESYPCATRQVAAELVAID